MSAHTLTAEELQTISQKAIDAKAKAYCTPRHHLPLHVGNLRLLMDMGKKAPTANSA